jgi:hypothetical protein
MSDTTIARISILAILCLSLWLANGVETHGQAAANGADPADPAETVILLIQTPHYDGSSAVARRAALVEILLHQPGVKRIMAYAVGMGDRLELWNEAAPPATGQQGGDPKREVLTRQLEMFIRETASNRAYSMSRIVDGIRIMMNSHADWIGNRFQNSNGMLPDEIYHMRLLAATQEIDPTFRTQVPVDTCQKDGDWESWPRGILVPRAFLHHGQKRDQRVTVFSVYDAQWAGNRKLNANIETFLHASLKRDGLAYGGVYYLDSPLRPEPPRGRPNDETRVCDELIKPSTPEEHKPRSSGDPRRAPAKSAAPTATPEPGRPTAPAPALAVPTPTPSPRAASPQVVEPRLPPVTPTPEPPRTPAPASPPVATAPPPPPAAPSPSNRLPESIQLPVTAGRSITRKLTDLLGPGAAGISILGPRMTERAAARQPGAGTLSGEIFRYLADADGQGDHRFDIEFVDAIGATRRLALIVKVTPPRPTPPQPTPAPLRPNDLGVSVSWTGAGVDLDVQIFAPDPRRTPAERLVPPGNVTRDRPGTARFLPRREESGSMVEKIILDRVPRGSYIAAVSIRAVSLTGCQRGVIIVAYRIDQTGPATYQRGGLQVGAAGSVPIPIACDPSGRLPRPVFAPLVEVNTP